MRSLPIVLVAVLLAGCSADVEPGPDAGAELDLSSGWPRLDGVTLTILDHGAFGAFDDAAARFENLTGARVVHVEAADAGGVLNRAVAEKGDPSFDVVYGIDNVLWTRAVEEGVFEPYTPKNASRVEPSLVFFDRKAPWPATPVDHGFIAVNWDPRHDALGDGPSTLDDLRAHAGRFVTQDPRTSTPGLGFLLVTIATYPEGSAYDWTQYWGDLFAGSLLVTPGWTEAYEQHFSGGYGADYGGLADRPIVTSYTTSPAYEAHFGRAEADLARVLTAPNATFHQVETMGIAKGTKNLRAAQAWIEFMLTDDFQSLVAPGMAMYPVVRGADVSATFGGVDPAPGTFAPAAFDAETLGANVERWVREWTELCEAARCA